MDLQDIAKSGLAGDKSSKPKKLHVHEVRVRRGKAGGYIAENHLKDENGSNHHEHDEYPMISMADVHKHMMAHLPEEKKEIAAEKNASHKRDDKPGMEEMD